MNIKLAILATSSLMISTSADAVLVSRMGGQAVYDTVNNLLWLSDANSSQTSGYAGTFDGTMDHAGAMTWVDSLNTGNYLGINNWRLPTTMQPDLSCNSVNGSTYYGDNCTGSELGDLFYVQLDMPNGGNASLSLFSNIMTNSPYWSDTPHATTVGNFWAFNFGSGFQFVYPDTNQNSAWAVRTGDVSTVPIPAAAWLFASGLTGLAGVARRKKA